MRALPVFSTLEYYLGRAVGKPGYSLAKVEVSALHLAFSAVCGSEMGIWLDLSSLKIFHLARVAVSVFFAYREQAFIWDLFCLNHWHFQVV